MPSTSALLVFNSLLYAHPQARNIIREGYGIDGDCMSDILCGLFCCQCVSCQLNDETKTRGNVKQTAVNGTGLLLLLMLLLLLFCRCCCCSFSLDLTFDRGVVQQLKQLHLGWPYHVPVRVLLSMLCRCVGPHPV